MNIYLEEPLSADREESADQTDAQEPRLTGAIRSFDRPAEILAVRLAGNPLDRRSEGRLVEAISNPRWASELPPGAALLMWSGTLAESLFAADPRNWMGHGSAALAARCDALAPLLEREGRTLCLQPHARHVLSDARSCLSFLSTRRGQPFSVAISPATMLEEAMLPAASEHMERLFEALGAAASMVMLADLRESPVPTEPPITCPLGEGTLSRSTIQRLLATHIDPARPIVLAASPLGEDGPQASDARRGPRSLARWEAQRRWLLDRE